MLQNLIICLHVGHLKMVDVHFLKGGGSGKVHFAHFGKWLTIMDDP